MLKFSVEPSSTQTGKQTPVAFVLKSSKLSMQGFKNIDSYRGKGMSNIRKIFLLNAHQHRWTTTPQLAHSLRS